jgi:hypothetical protein
MDALEMLRKYTLRLKINILLCSKMLRQHPLTPDSHHVPLSIYLYAFIRNTEVTTVTSYLGIVSTLRDTYVRSS